MLAEALEHLVQGIVSTGEEMLKALKNHDPAKYDRWKEWGFASIKMNKIQ